MFVFAVFYVYSIISDVTNDFDNMINEILFSVSLLLLLCWMIAISSTVLRAQEKTNNQKAKESKIRWFNLDRIYLCKTKGAIFGDLTLIWVALCFLNVVTVWSFTLK